MDDIAGTIVTAALVAIPLILAITMHETAHGYVALAFGDPTAKERGRLTLNPFRHVDLFGTVILPAMLFLARAPLFGWAKPVPVDFGRLRNPRRDMIWVALAGPGMNFALALVSALLFHAISSLPAEAQPFAHELLNNSLLFNVTLAVFNLLPLPPLDGSRVLMGILPLPAARALARQEKYGILLLIGLLVALPFLGSKIGVDLDLFARVILPIVERVIVLIAGIAGISVNLS